ncbi:hypothetical protein P691DRAFT_665649 [Macrolepiota fuliginosa MF-IS2]|uniref:NACHT domain-containing protein n=1 Tax=Macrolepiota fuliginosa MF-IS2 TaxID=1400762 RepID=A0A9P5XF77_9AGAR|nr:hypothetical protein P691DRAFT_665649 [Macrolepiota fuliginosa MF-IS2]
MPGAEVDSSARDPPPRCHPDTRKSLRSRIIHWFTNPRRDWRILWVLGPVGVGKSAVAQTIAEEFKASGRLGAAVFFSRHCRDDPDRVVATLAYQLAIQHPDYKNILTQRLADDSTILEKSRRSQFKQLVVEPFKMLAVRNTTCVQEPLLIVLDGLDECNGEEAQCELIELISEHAHLMSGLLWMICSRPEWHLQSILSQTDFHVRCKREELPVDDTEAQRDVSLVLQQSFYEIREKYRDRVDESWPPEAQLRRIAATASGLFAFSSTLTRFVGDKYKGDPHGQLEVCMKFLDGVPGVVNPLHALDLLYRQMMCDIAGETLPTTMRILGLSILYPHVGLPARIQANFLCLDRTAFYRSLQQLHSVLYVPKPSDAHNTNMYFYHASFADFLRDPHRSGTFCLDQAAIHYDVAVHALRWNKRGIQFLKVERSELLFRLPDSQTSSFQQICDAYYSLS